MAALSRDNRSTGGDRWRSSYCAGLAERPWKFLGAIPVAISFHATKAFGTGEGGAVATDDVPLARRSAQALNFGISGIRDCQMPSTNGKMSRY